MKAIKRQLCKAGVMVAVGLILIVVSVVSPSDNAYVPSLGGSFSLVGLIQLVRFVRIARDPVRAKRFEIAMTEERAVLIERQSGFWMFYITLFAEAAALVVFMLLDRDELVSVLAPIICAQCLLKVVIQWVLAKKY